MHLARRGYLLIVLMALLGIAGTWSDDPMFESAWLLPAFFLLAGLAVEAWHLRGTQLSVRVDLDSRLRLGRPARGAFTFAHNRGLELRLQYARVLPAALRPVPAVRELALAAGEESHDEFLVMPLRLGAARFDTVHARLLGRLQLAWWTRGLPQDARISVAPDSLPRGARPVAGESAGETPRRLPGVGVELLQLREYAPGDALSRIDWKATARRGALVSREYSEAQHLEIVMVVDASRASRVRAGDLDRLGLYANVAARLAEYAVSVEDRVGVLVYAERTLRACLPDRGTRALIRLRHALETLDTQRGEPDPVAAAIQVRRMLRHRGLVVWLTDLADPARNEALLQAVKALVPRHLPIVAAPHAVEIDRLASAPAREWRDPSVAIAAREYRQRARLQVAAMRQQGVVVLDEADDQLDRAVLDSYLQLRTRRRV